MNRLKGLFTNRLKYLAAWLILFTVFISGVSIAITVPGSGVDQKSFNSGTYKSSNAVYIDRTLKNDTGLNASGASLTSDDNSYEELFDEPQVINLAYYKKDGANAKVPSPKEKVIKIKSGDTLWGLASTYDVDLDELIKLNDIKKPNSLKIGQEIKLPVKEEQLLNETVKDIEKISAKKPETKKVKAAVNKSKASAVTLASRSGAQAARTPNIAGGWPAAGVIYSRFGYRGSEFHKGVDIAAPSGTDIFAYNSGQVIFSAWDGGYGRLVIIDHGDGMKTYYGHCSKLLVGVGERVEQGQHIADMGRSGDATGNHLHFEVRINDKAVNPLNYLN
ncbi:murein hydrolase activator NlpD precursor [Oxobacter pfennigii]|uniref:Murein hydrolase activator NlpD n=1 Tax=Oxobacter pfennigii TaxID=36849 RepID=A0A0P9AB56_9CLOT|nr:peptidoglycan DD-metalloendopeptidase family protein [Oxobacter pfennigii]KPU42291.1 murein hydrolase activator NlpD precursor [Oxobacter pfennigii]